MNHQKATRLLRELRRRKDASSVRFGKFVTECEKKCHISGDWVGLSALLISPIQRVLRYRMLLTEFIKYTDEDHLDYAPLTQALVEVEWVAMEVNEAVRDQEQYEELQRLDDKFITNPGIAKMQRKLLYQGKMDKQCRNKVVAYHFWLFTDLLIYADRPTGSKYVLHKKIVIDGAFQVSDAESTKHALDIVNTKRSFRVYLKSKEEKDKWLEHLQKAIRSERIIILPPLIDFGLIFKNNEVIDVTDEGQGDKAGIKVGWKVLRMNRLINPSDGLLQEIIRTVTLGKPTTIVFQTHNGNETAKPIWTRDNAVNGCPLCSRKFTVTYRRHHCRACGTVVCSKCSKNKHAIIKGNEKLKRVCNDCHDNLAKGSDNWKDIENRRSSLVKNSPETAVRKPSFREQIKNKQRSSSIDSIMDSLRKGKELNNSSDDKNEEGSNEEENENKEKNGQKEKNEKAEVVKSDDKNEEGSNKEENENQEQGGHKEENEEAGEGKNEEGGKKEEGGKTDQNNDSTRS